MGLGGETHAPGRRGGGKESVRSWTPVRSFRTNRGPVTVDTSPAVGRSGGEEQERERERRRQRIRTWRRKEGEGGSGSSGRNRKAPTETTVDGVGREWWVRLDPDPGEEGGRAPGTGLQTVTEGGRVVRTYRPDNRLENRGLATDRESLPSSLTSFGVEIWVGGAGSE